MPSLKIEKVIVALTLSLLMAIIIFYDMAVGIVGMFSDNPARAVWGFSGTLFAIAFGWIIKIIISSNDAQTQLFQLKMEKNFSDGVAGLSENIKGVKDDVSDVVCETKLIGHRVSAIETTLIEMNHYKDEKKRHWMEYDSDWQGIKADFAKLGNNDIYAMARIIKDSLREYIHEVTVSDLKRSTKAIVDEMEERGRAYREDVVHRSKLMLPPEFVDEFIKADAPNIDAFRSQICELLTNDKINNRAESIHLAARQLMRRIHNTLWLTWSRWAEENADKLAADPVERYFKTPHLR